MKYNLSSVSFVLYSVRPQKSCSPFLQSFVRFAFFFATRDFRVYQETVLFSPRTRTILKLIKSFTFGVVKLKSQLRKFLNILWRVPKSTYKEFNTGPLFIMIAFRRAHYRIAAVYIFPDRHQNFSLPRVSIEIPYFNTARCLFEYILFML